MFCSLKEERLFKILAPRVIDANGDGEVTLDEFVFGCMQLQGAQNMLA